MTKRVETIGQAAVLAGLRDGMRISFHHHLRNGDYVLNRVMEAAAALGIKNLTVNASSLFDIHEPLIGHIRSRTVTGLEVNYMTGPVARAVSEGILDQPVIFRSHGGRAGDMDNGTLNVDIAFIAAPCADEMGNCSGKYGPSACGSLGYAFSDAVHAKKVVVITDHLVPYPLQDASIQEGFVDYVVCIDRIGDASRIVSGTTRITRDPVGLKIARLAAQVIIHSGYLKDGFSFQTGAGGISLAVANDVREAMIRGHIRGSFCMGGITEYLVRMMEEGLFSTILDVQCFDMGAVKSLRENPGHQEISASRYASPAMKSCAADHLDVVVLGATQIDLRFNVNVHTDSNGYIIGGCGGHCDTAAGAKMTVIVAPLIRARIPLVVENVLCRSTPGHTVDVLVTQCGIAVNPNNPDLRERLLRAGLPVTSIEKLKETAEDMCGKPKLIRGEGRVVAEVLYRDGSCMDEIHMVQRC